MTEQEQLFATYYNKGKLLVVDMDDTQLREHREQLAKIATEAKAVLLAADEEIRERGAKKKLKEKDWLVTVDQSQTASDAINAVKQRKSRMSAMDKLNQQLIAAGIDDETRKQMISDLERRATDKGLKTVTFNKPAVETAVVQVKAESNGEKKPFDPSKLSFGS